MKKYIFILVCLIYSFISYSQVTIEHGYLSDKGIFEFESSSSLKENFTWKLLRSDSTVSCFVHNDKNFIETLSWKFMDVTYKEDITRFLVRASSGDIYYIDFLKDGKLVLILNAKDNKYSAMVGDGVRYTTNLD